MLRILLLGAVFLSATAQTAVTQAPKLKVHISVDMEGVAGVVTGDQLGPDGLRVRAASASS